MLLLVSAFILLPVADWLLKGAVESRLGLRAVRLGGAGELRLTRSPVLWQRRGNVGSLRMLWAIWVVSALLLLPLCCMPPTQLWAGLLLGGSLSHAIETSLRGGVRDYCALHFLPTFNLADVAIAAGSAGCVIKLLGRIAAQIASLA